MLASLAFGGGVLFAASLGNRNSMVNEAIKNLTRMGWKVEKHGNKWIAVSSGKFLHDYRNSDLYSDRQLIHLARAVYHTPEGKKIVKRVQHKRLRRRTRQQMHKEDFDSIFPTIKNGNSKEDPWSYD